MILMMILTLAMSTISSSEIHMVDSEEDSLLWPTIDSLMTERGFSDPMLYEMGSNGDWGDSLSLHRSGIVFLNIEPEDGARASLGISGDTLFIENVETIMWNGEPVIIIPHSRLEFF